MPTALPEDPINGARGVVPSAIAVAYAQDSVGLGENLPAGTVVGGERGAFGAGTPLRGSETPGPVLLHPLVPSAQPGSGLDGCQVGAVPPAVSQPSRQSADRAAGRCPPTGRLAESAASAYRHSGVGGSASSGVGGIDAISRDLATPL